MSFDNLRTSSLTVVSPDSRRSSASSKINTNGFWSCCKRWISQWDGEIWGACLTSAKYWAALRRAHLCFSFPVGIQNILESYFPVTDVLRWLPLKSFQILVNSKYRPDEYFCYLSNDRELPRILFYGRKSGVFYQVQWGREPRDLNGNNKFITTVIFYKITYFLLIWLRFPWEYISIPLG